MKGLERPRKLGWESPNGVILAYLMRCCACVTAPFLKPKKKGSFWSKLILPYVPFLVWCGEEDGSIPLGKTFSVLSYTRRYLPSKKTVLGKELSVFTLNSVFVFYQPSQTSTNEQKLLNTWNVGKWLCSPSVSSDAVLERSWCYNWKVGFILFIFIRDYCQKVWVWNINLQITKEPKQALN